MENDAPDKYSRRKFLEIGSAAVATAGALSAASAAAQSPETIMKARTDRSSSDPVPQNPPLDTQNPDSNIPLPTDHGAVQTFKYPFSFAHKRQHEGGWSREVTVRELAVSKSLAGVNMRLTAGGIRELHWHAAAEWAFMLYGSARITAVDAEGKGFVSDVKEGDIWYFPTGIPHSIQGLRPDGCEFLLVFDDGNFSEYETILIADWMGHTPRDVLAKNFNVPQSAFRKMPGEELYIFQREVPGALAADEKAVAGPNGTGTSAQRFDFRLTSQQATKQTKGGEVRIVDSKSFPVSTTIAAALVTVHPGGMRELHWHPNADEWQYYIKGKARMTVFAAAGRARTMDFDAGDVGYIQKTLPHYIENTGTSDLTFLEMFKSSFYQDISLSEWISHLPPELVAAHLQLDQATIDAIPREKSVIMPL
jgi:oxalate decarboxylase